LLDTTMKHAPVGRFERQRQPFERQLRWRRLRQQGRHRLPRQQVDFHRALYALGIGGLQARGGGRIDVGQAAVQCRHAMARDVHVDLRAQCRVGAWQIIQPVAQSLEIQHRAPDQQWQLAA